MIQRFIELGQGYSDLFELMEIAKRNQDRISAFVRLDVEKDSQKKSSLVVLLNPTEQGSFMPLYICLEGIPHKNGIESNNRYELFSALGKQFEVPIKTLEVKSYTQFAEKDLYYQYLIGIFRLNKLIPPLS
ncbi:hypothetical protein [Alkalihalobacillus trypoxylicola]|uniref:Methylthioribose kinase n=1 Tax=Alkalihalobacillus trypoxylicola TaxID=519424 RepID=A0A161QBA9_9BACI|nr:hypothetical protein [Alkalihalobacillus trypoxylicola]KYG35197.1 methylthioribose kinase [Alkalihalobacillus trypoxylicola]GAF63951.1 hypothetical protein BTS2_0843 [Bacillus sp. TS-2]